MVNLLQELRDRVCGLGAIVCLEVERMSCPLLALLGIPRRLVRALISVSPDAVDPKAVETFMVFIKWGCRLPLFAYTLKHGPVCVCVPVCWYDPSSSESTHHCVPVEPGECDPRFQKPLISVVQHLENGLMPGQHSDIIMVLNHSRIMNNYFPFWQSWLETSVTGTTINNV